MQVEYRLYIHLIFHVKNLKQLQKCNSESPETGVHQCNSESPETSVHNSNSESPETSVICEH
jgi:hypothetical protein